VESELIHSPLFTLQNSGGKAKWRKRRRRREGGGKEWGGWPSSGTNGGSFFFCVFLVLYFCPPSCSFSFSLFCLYCSSLYQQCSPLSVVASWRCFCSRWFTVADSRWQTTVRGGFSPVLFCYSPSFLSPSFSVFILSLSLVSKTISP